MSLTILPVVKEQEFRYSCLSSDTVHPVLEYLNLLEFLIYLICFRTDTVLSYIACGVSALLAYKLHAVIFLQRLLVVQPLVPWQGCTVDPAVSSLCFLLD
jgi:hypothetical protein